jgi:hypothetical protein
MTVLLKMAVLGVDPKFAEMDAFISVSASAASKNRSCFFHRGQLSMVECLMEPGLVLTYF